MLMSAVEMAKNITQLEASGNIDEDNIVSIAETGVDYISIGAITKNVSAVDLSLRFT
jgi:nicotinate-nucleotide pyrophosphorylase (carboxylating)